MEFWNKNMKKIQKPHKPQSLSVTILKLVGIGVAITAASIISPPFLYILVKGYLKYQLRDKYTTKQIQKSFAYLHRKKFIAYTGKGKKGKIILTALGQRHFKKLQLKDVTIKKNTWDGKWRFLLFDIAETYRTERHIFRKKLQEMGFYHFQRSVFVTPHKCEQEIKSIKMLLGLESSVYLITASRFPGDDKLVKEFGL